MASSEQTVAVLGAGGTMGRAIAANILGAKFPLRAWNRSREKAEPLAEHGATVLDTPARAAEGASIVVTMLTDTDAVIEAMDGADGFLSAAERPLVWAQMSTIGVSGTERCAEIAERHDVTFVDAPVLGTKEPAEKGELVVLASGPDEARELLDPMFAAVGKKTMWVGPAGAGTRLKVVTNSWLVAVVEGVAETIALAEGAGVDPHRFLEAIAGGPLDLPYLQMKAKAMIERDFEPSFRLALGAKDAKLADEMAKRHELELPLISTICERMAEGVAEHGEEDLSATFLTSAPKQTGRS
jgi:3-hydroxyisobutyrate dehydrogenase